MFKYFLALFVLVPLAELYVLIEVGKGIGGLSTIALCLFTAVLGGILIRWQGLKTLFDAQRSLSRGEFPAEHGLHGLLIGLSGLLLFTPGFITDTIGFLLLVPLVRKLIIRYLLKLPPGSGPSEVIIDAEIIRHDRHIP